MLVQGLKPRAPQPAEQPGLSTLSHLYSLDDFFNVEGCGCGGDLPEEMMYSSE